MAGFKLRPGLFVVWLRDQVDRDDPVGQYARWAREVVAQFPDLEPDIAKTWFAAADSVGMKYCYEVAQAEYRVLKG